MVPFANAGNQETVVNQGQAKVIDLPPIESYPRASIQWFEQQGQHLPIPTETQVWIIHCTKNVVDSTKSALFHLSLVRGILKYSHM